MKKKLTILYIDDNSTIRKKAVEYLSRRYQSVLEAKDGQEAWDIYKDMHPDIIFTDIKMPNLNGLELINLIRKENKTIPIIIISAFIETTYLLSAVELQLIKYMVKPVTSEKMKEALTLAEEALQEHKKENIFRLCEHTTYDIFNKKVIINNEEIKLSHNEMTLLELLIENNHRVVHYEEIERAIWSYEGMSMDALRYLVRALRKKLQGDFIENISGVGYRITH
jgi:DNA-binding response OmpR family regulator